MEPRNKPSRGPTPLTKRIGTELRQTFRSLRLRDFRLYTIGQLLSLSGTWMQSVALSWLVYSLTESAAALGMVALASGVPMLLFTYAGGIIADRFDRKRVLSIAVSLNLLQATTLAALTFSGLISVNWILALAFAAGCIGAVELPARQSFVPDLVGKDELTNAIGLNSAVRNTTRILGPALAGVLIAAFGEAVCFGLNAISYLAALFTLIMINTGCSGDTCSAEFTPKRKAAEAKSAKESIWSVLGAPAILGVMLLAAATSMFGFQYTVLLPVVVDRVLGGDATTLGFLSAAAGIGALLGSLALASRGEVKSLRRGIGLAGLVLAVAISGLAYSAILPLSLLAVAAAGAAISIQFGGSMSIVQTAVDGRKRGRVMAVFSMFMIGFAPFAAMLAGSLAELIGVSMTLYTSATAVLLAAVVYLLFEKRQSSRSNESS